MTDDLSMAQAEDEPPLVEDVWEDILVEFGFDRERAAQIKRAVFGMGELTLTERQPEEIRQIVADELEALDFESEIGSQSGTLRELLKSFLDAGLEGKLLGPACAPGEIKYAAADSRATAFDSIRNHVSRSNVSLETIDLSQFPSDDESDEPLDKETTGTEMSPSPSFSPAEQRYTTARSQATDLEEVGRSGETSDSLTSDTERILEFIHNTIDDDSPIVRKQAMTSLASLARVPGVRSDRHIERLIEAYQSEPDPEVRATIVAGLEEYLEEDQMSGDRSSGGKNNGSTETDKSENMSDDPRDADTSPF